jgi:chromo domain-containing protein 1
MGDVVFLTDDVFLHKPGKVLAIIDKINKSNKAKPLGATRNKIATRPGIKAWLADLVINQKEGTDDPRLSMLLTEIWKLCPIEKENEEYPGHPSENADVISLAPEQLPTFQTLLQTDRAKATDYIVNWFAGWAFMNASKFRRFTVCHEEPGTGEKVLDKDYNLVTKGIADPRNWGEAFKYLLVKTPDQWIEKEEAKVRPTERS